MIHAHDFLALHPTTPPFIPSGSQGTRTPTPSVPSEVEGRSPIRPGEYLRLRREAARLTHADVAALIAPKDARLGIIRGLELIERNDIVILDRTRADMLARLARAFPFDPDVYGQLADDPADRHPQICRRCGCSHWDPCPHDIGGACAWAEPDLCTACAEPADTRGDA